MVIRKVSLTRENFLFNFSNLIGEQEFTDVTLVSADDHQIKAHKVILISSSNFFKKILSANSHPHPLIYLRGVNKGQLKNIIQFIYLGEIQMDESEVDDFINLGKELKIECLFDDQVTSLKEDYDVAKLEKCDTLEESVNEVNLTDTSFEYATNFYVNNSRTIEKKDAKFSCRKCELSFEHNASLKKHILSKHEDVRYQCEKCDKKYSDPSALLRHKKAVHDGFNYKCEVCTKRFSDDITLGRHTNKYHA